MMHSNLISGCMASSPAAVRELQRDLENQANALSKIQKGMHHHSLYIAKNHQVRKQYTIQLGENELVLKELELLNENSNVFKLIGPVLVKQDLAEANANVRKRIEYISAELKRLDGTLQDLEDKQNSKKESLKDGFPVEKGTTWGLSYHDRNAGSVTNLVAGFGKEKKLPLSNKSFWFFLLIREEGKQAAGGGGFTVGDFACYKTYFRERSNGKAGGRDEKVLIAGGNQELFNVAVGWMGRFILPTGSNWSPGTPFGRLS
ncbi:hypothetical protein ZIOFF_028235 [Zingiber officinale]|uniref:Prefoldin subunit 6 n=1 Tax=Zingiber officinale TaxID=94328 RepID=A0A8J5GUQ1_ZINOF|nr:hypothetical protein ZIOFF_028235 [Zingiber officinale]